MDLNGVMGLANIEQHLISRLSSQMLRSIPFCLASGNTPFIPIEDLDR